MKKMLFLLIVTASMLLGGCVHIVPVGGADTDTAASIATDDTPAVTDGGETEKQPDETERENEAQGEFPNVPEDGYSKLY